MYSCEPCGNHPGTRARNGVDCRTKPPVGLCKTAVQFCAGPLMEGKYANVSFYM
jgi:hypothetical protein